MKIVPKIDIHIHTTPDPIAFRADGSTMASPAEIRAMYDMVGIEKGVLLPLLHEESNREARDLVRAYPETFGWWFCNLQTHWHDNNPDMDWTEILRCMKKHGAKGIGEIEENLYFDDPFVLNLFKYAEKENMPVLFHVGVMNNDYGLVTELGLGRLEKVLQMFPKLKFLGHSQKFWAEISETTEEERNTYPKGKVKPGRVVELMRKYPNLYGDLSAGSGYNAMTRDPEFTYGFMEEFQDRLLFGTDIADRRNVTNPMLKLSKFLDDSMLNGKISYAAYEKISRGNALNILEG